MPSLTIQPGVGIPPAGLIERFYSPMGKVARTWAAVARVVPIQITSWWRDPTRNVSVGGQTYSQHLLGCAMDGLSPQLSREQLLPLVQRAAAYYGVSVPTLASEGSGRSVHVQGLPYGMTQQILTREPQLIATTLGFIGPPRPVV